jgi:hypothetical protein
VRFVRPATRRTAALGAVTGALIIAVIAAGGGQARASTPAITGAPLGGSASATLTQVSAGEWTTTVFLDTAALCTGDNPAGTTFSLVTGKPNSVTGAAAPIYPDGPLACGAVAANPVTQVKLTFSPSLSAVPLTATLTVTPPQALLLAGDPPVQIPLTVRRSVSPWQYVWIPAICGGALALLLLLTLVLIGLPGRGDGRPAAPTQPAPVRPGQPAPPGGHEQDPARAQADFNTRLLVFLMSKRHEVLLTELSVAAGKAVAVAGLRAAAKGAADEPRPSAESGRPVRRVHWGPEFWLTPLFAGAAWSFGDSWATSVTPLTALAGGVLTASGAVAGLVPGVDLTRIGLLMALVGALTTFAPLVFMALSSLFPERKASPHIPPGEVVAASLWVMLLASCLTVFAIGAEIGFVGLVLGFDLIVVSPEIRWIGPALTGLAAILFLAYGAHSILTLTGQPSGAPKTTAKKSSFMI